MMAPSEFQPVFVVGCPRSGTTLLATLLDRHSRIAIPPETEFFLGVLPRNGRDRAGAAHEHYVDRLFSHPRTADLGLSREEVTARFRRYDPSYATLFMAALEGYAAKEGKARPGEKTPDHLRCVPRLLRLYPEARVVCIIRDGRDVVVSLNKTPWASKSLGRNCAKWNYYAMLAERYRGDFPGSFTVVRFEDLVRSPRVELARITSFLGEAMEEALLAPGGSKLVPAWEREWKSNSGAALDTSKIGQWRTSTKPAERAFMNRVMGRRLSRWGYPVESGRAALGLLGAARAVVYGEPLSSRLFQVKIFLRAALSSMGFEG